MPNTAALRNARNAIQNEPRDERTASAGAYTEYTKFEERGSSVEELLREIHKHAGACACAMVDHAASAAPGGTTNSVWRAG